MFLHNTAGSSRLGLLVPNHAIRRATYAEMAVMNDVCRITGNGVVWVANHRDVSKVTLDDGETMCTAPVVATASRFSSLAAGGRHPGKHA
ncbi:hypothetical protein [Dyella sp. A6]|uniref:hypothetical protein n=1 Tax=Dyella aluminiiresistens TaxID=3069105 RepID=UPI002E7AA490|nr:hypothetical protein [Dyella sp. A6]